MTTTIRLCAALFALTAFPALAGDDARYTLKAPTQAGSVLLNRSRDVAFSGKIPFDKRYDELTAEQKQVVRAPYEAMAPGDEPPFPAEGLAAVYGPIAKMQSKLLADGEVRMFVKVGADGKAQSIEVYKSPNPAVARAIANLLMLVPYKPGVCGGTPCEMEFPAYIKLMTTR